MYKILSLGTHLFVKVPRLLSRSRYLDKVPRLDHLLAKGPFRSSSQAATCYYQSNHSKVEAISLSALPKDTTSKLASVTSHYPFLCWTSIWRVF